MGNKRAYQHHSAFEKMWLMNSFRVKKYWKGKRRGLVNLYGIFKIDQLINSKMEILKSYLFVMYM